MCKKRRKKENRQRGKGKAHILHCTHYTISTAVAKEAENPITEAVAPSTGEWPRGTTAK